MANFREKTVNFFKKTGSFFADWGSNIRTHSFIGSFTKKEDDAIDHTILAHVFNTKVGKKIPAGWGKAALGIVLGLLLDITTVSIWTALGKTIRDMRQPTAQAGSTKEVAANAIAKDSSSSAKKTMKRTRSRSLTEVDPAILTAVSAADDMLVTTTTAAPEIITSLQLGASNPNPLVVQPESIVNPQVPTGKNSPTVH